ncbi:MAG: hypothetical protein J6U54_18345 [Clostridiales bacterium]|nr:hypothetical protein [Clostridiales bacterium]
MNIDVKKIWIATLILTFILSIACIFVFGYTMTRVNDTKAYMMVSNDVDDLVNGETKTKTSEQVTTVEQEKPDYAPVIMLLICFVTVLGFSIYFGIKHFRPVEKIDNFADKMINLNTDGDPDINKLISQIPFDVTSIINEKKESEENEVKVEEDLVTQAKRMVAEPVVELFRMYPTRFELVEFLEEELGNCINEDHDINLKTPSYNIFIVADQTRFSQALSSIMNDLYSETDVDITVKVAEYAIISFKGSASSFSDEELAHVFDKKEDGREELYIAKYIIEHSNGTISAVNDDGLLTEVHIPIAK